MSKNIICEKLLGLKPYDPEILSSGIHLDANESFLELPEDMKRNIGDRIAEISFNRYPDPLAMSCCQAFAKRYGIGPEYVTAGNGSDELLSVLFNDFLQRGDTALLTEPDFSMYQLYCKLAQARTVILKKGNDLTFDPDTLIQKAKEEKAKLVLFSNPCNPTGQGISFSEVLHIADSLDCLVVADEAYMDFWDQSAIKAAPKTENLLVLKTCSKIGFAASRLGFAIGNAKLTGYLRAAKSPYNVNVLTQAAGEIFLNDENYLPGAVEKIKASRDALYQSLKNLAAQKGAFRVYGTHTNFVTVRLPKAAVMHAKLRNQGISVRLIGDSLLRITAGSDRENETFLKNFKIILNQL